MDTILKPTQTSEHFPGFVEIYSDTFNDAVTLIKRYPLPLLLLIVIDFGTSVFQPVTKGTYAATAVSAIILVISYIVNLCFIYLYKHRHHSVDIGSSMTAVSDVLLSFIFASLIQIVVITIGVAFFLIPGIVAALSLFVTGFVVMYENMGPLNALGRSIILMDGYRMRVFRYILPFFILVLFSSFLLQFFGARIGLTAIELQWLKAILYSPAGLLSTCFVGNVYEPLSRKKVAFIAAKAKVSRLIRFSLIVLAGIVLIVVYFAWVFGGNGPSWSSVFNRRSQTQQFQATPPKIRLKK
ncbi:MAG: hypothetical protein ABI758_03790 [Candidatus Woesebacteria bacterium]